MIGRDIAVEPPIHELKDAVCASLGTGSARTQLIGVTSQRLTADTTLKAVVKVERRALAFVHCANRLAPDMVKRAMDRARDAKQRLGAVLGAAVLDPISEGRIEGLSYAVLPYCRPLSSSIPGWPLQRLFVSRESFDWLAEAARTSTNVSAPVTVQKRFRKVLEDFAGFTPSATLRTAAELAIERLDRGAWKPRTVVMHGDFWKENILLRPNKSSSARNRLVFVD